METTKNRIQWTRQNASLHTAQVTRYGANFHLRIVRTPGGHGFNVTTTDDQGDHQVAWVDNHGLSLAAAKRTARRFLDQQ